MVIKVTIMIVTLKSKDVIIFTMDRPLSDTWPKPTWETPFEWKLWFEEYNRAKNPGTRLTAKDVKSMCELSGNGDIHHI